MRKRKRRSLIRQVVESINLVVDGDLPLDVKSPDEIIDWLPSVYRPIEDGLHWGHFCSLPKMINAVSDSYGRTARSAGIPIDAISSQRWTAALRPR